MRKFIALYDVHCGYELRLRGGKRVKTPTHSPEALKAVLAFARDFQPDTLILGGDQLDIGAISDHNHGKPRLVENLRVQDDYDALDNLVLKPVDEFLKAGWLKSPIWLTGNHENRVRRYLDAHPGVEGLLEPDIYLKLAQRGWTLQEEEVPYALGKLHFVHGHAAFPRGGVADAAKKLVSRYRKSIVCGHLHTYSVATDVTPADASDYHTGTICPALGIVNPGYRLNAPGNENLGFAWGYVLPDGNFTLYISLIADGKFTANGKTYGVPGDGPFAVTPLDRGVRSVSGLVLTDDHRRALDGFKRMGRASVNVVRTTCGFWGPKCKRIYEELRDAGYTKEWEG